MLLFISKKKNKSASHRKNQMSTNRSLTFISADMHLWHTTRTRDTTKTQKYAPDIRQQHVFQTAQFHFISTRSCDFSAD